MVGIAGHIKTDKFSGGRFVVAPAEQFAVTDYLDYNLRGYSSVPVSGLVGLPVGAGNRQFYIEAGSRDAAMKILKVKFPGGILQPHYSDFNQVETYYTYEVTK